MDPFTEASLWLIGLTVFMLGVGMWGASASQQPEEERPGHIPFKEKLKQRQASKL